MKKPASISTKTGDSGESSLANGERLPKDHPRFEAIGTVDELNSSIGFVLAVFDGQFAREAKELKKIQEILFHLGAELALSPKTKLQSRHLRMLETWASRLEKAMAAHWHNKFLLPGGVESAARLDMARVICRRAERRLATLSQMNKVRPLVFRYLNRLSDYLYLLRTFVNAQVEHKETEFNTETS